MVFWLPAIAVLMLIAAPIYLEMRRQPMGRSARKKAPGQFATLSDGETHFQWHGPVNGRVMICIHGLSTPSWVFSGLIRGLTVMGFRVLTYDLFGRGFSDRPRGVQDRAFFLRQLNELLKDQGVGTDLFLMGYSMGGAIATAFAAEQPDRVFRLILLAPAGISYTPAPLLANARRFGLAGDWLWGLLGARQLRRGASADAKLPSVITNLPQRMRAETSFRGYLRSVLSAERHMLTEVQEFDHRELKSMYVAVVSIWGEEDRIIPVSAVGKLAEWNRDAYKYVIPGATHALGYTHPREILAAIQENLREV